jgi:hypothetical protein
MLQETHPAQFFIADLLEGQPLTLPFTCGKYRMRFESCTQQVTNHLRTFRNKQTFCLAVFFCSSWRTNFIWFLLIILQSY